MNPLTPEQHAQRAAWLKQTMGQIPADHDWARAVVILIKSLSDESLPLVIAPPGSVTQDDRTYNAGRVAFAEDLLQRLEMWHRAAFAAEEQSKPVHNRP